MKFKKGDLIALISSPQFLYFVKDINKSYTLENWWLEDERTYLLNINEVDGRHYFITDIFRENS